MSRPLTFAVGLWVLYLFIIRLVFFDVELEDSDLFMITITSLSTAMMSGSVPRLLLSIGPILMLIGVAGLIQGLLSRIAGGRAPSFIHIDIAAYGVGALATTLLITIYSSSILTSGKLTAFLFGLLTVMYGFIYMILQLEDTALLVGSIGLFIILATVMIWSRKVDWYRGINK